MTTESPKFKKLVAKLRELFELDKADLDFGIYRVLRARREEIDRFLREELLPQVKQELGVVTEEKTKQFEAKVEEEIQLVMNYGGKSREEAEQAEPVKKAKALLEQARNPAAIEDEVYSLLTTFFGRYYEEGDFISLRRYSGPGKERYMLPYNGEEVKLVWANMDQYYIKSAENFRDYAFRIPPLEADSSIPEPDLRRCVRFKLVEASTEKDNVKTANGKRLFALADLEEHPLTVTEQDGVETLEIPFIYSLHGKDAKQDALLEAACSTLLSHADLPAEFANGLGTLAPTDKRPERTVLEKHLESYAAKNSFDYFIHKNLGGFLTRELDYFLKSDVLRVDDLLTEDEHTRALTLKKAKAFKLVAEKIITFLHRLEQFQKKLWLKKKFVVETRYCITLDRVPVELHPAICACETQWKEWEELYDLKVPEADRTSEFLTQNAFLVLDTKHFDRAFLQKLVALIGNLDEQLDGVCFHSENFQALQLMQEKYHQTVKCVYTDPPYNTSENAFLYKNEYKHSSWASMIYDRLLKAGSLLDVSGTIGVAIDDTESGNLRKALDAVFGVENYLSTISIEVNPAGQNIRPNVPARSHDYCHLYAKDSNLAKLELRELTEEEKAQFKLKDKKGPFIWDNLRRRGGNSRPTDRPGQWFPLYASAAQNMVSIEPFDGAEEFWPIDPKGEKRIWRVNRAGAKREIEAGEIGVIEKAGRLEISKKSRMPEGKKPKTQWNDSKYSATTHGTKLLIDILGDNQFSYPKSLWLVVDTIRFWTSPNSTILDFFAGSGTTAHAVIELNREMDGRLKYVLIEMGEHFDSAVVPRIKKVVYSPDWRDGKPTTRDKGISHCFKVLKLESYEDCLNNLILQRTEAQQELLAQNPSVREDYLLGYFLDVETRGSVLQLDQFSNPWSYQLSIATGSVGESKPTTIDLVETFNWLLGLQVEHISPIEHLRPDKGFAPDDNGRLQLASPHLRSAKPEEHPDCRSFQTVEGTLRTGEKTLIIWRTLTQPAKNQEAAHALEEDNVMLEEFLSRKAINPREKQWDLIFVNGDHTLDNLAERLSLEASSAEEAVHFKVRTIEPEFQRLMFEGTED